MILYQTTQGVLAESGGKAYALPYEWDVLFNRDDLLAFLTGFIEQAQPVADVDALAADRLHAPIGQQEVWAAGVTYQRSRSARMEESAEAGGGTFYDKVYHAHRPELFFKTTPHRVAGPGQDMYLRSDSSWNVPEPELTLAVTSSGKVVGYTAGNDLSSRDIEGENPLYLPQAKMFNRCAALGPGLRVCDGFPALETGIALEVLREGQAVMAGQTQLSQMKQTLPNLVEHLMRDNSHPWGAYLMTGTGIVPDDNDFTLQTGDEMRITIDGVGTLSNTINQPQK